MSKKIKEKLDVFLESMENDTLSEGVLDKVKDLAKGALKSFSNLFKSTEYREERFQQLVININNMLFILEEFSSRVKNDPETLRKVKKLKSIIKEGKDDESKKLDLWKLLISPFRSNNEQQKFIALLTLVNMYRESTKNSGTGDVYKNFEKLSNTSRGKKEIENSIEIVNELYNNIKNNEPKEKNMKEGIFSKEIHSTVTGDELDGFIIKVIHNKGNNVSLYMNQGGSKEEEVVLDKEKNPKSFACIQRLYEFFEGGDMNKPRTQKYD